MAGRSWMAVLAASSILIAPACAQDTPDQRAIRSKVTACGIADARLTLGRDATLQQNFVRIAAGEAATDAQLDCVAAAVETTSYAAWFSDEAEGDRYMARLAIAQAARQRTGAEAWLRERGLLDRLPKFSPGAELTEVARTIEAFCAITPKGALRAGDKELEAEAKALSPEKARCVTSTMIASGMAQRGLTFSLVVTP